MTGDVLKGSSYEINCQDVLLNVCINMDKSFFHVVIQIVYCPILSKELLSFPDYNAVIFQTGNTDNMFFLHHVRKSSQI